MRRLCAFVKEQSRAKCSMPSCCFPLTIQAHRDILIGLSAQSSNCISWKLEQPLLPLTHILLPHKEVMTEQNAGAVATIVAQHVKLSSTDQNFKVFGQIVNDAPFPGVDYVPMTPRFSWMRGRNIGLARAYVQKSNGMLRPDLVEVHGRAQVARYLCRKRPDLPIILYLHNDPRKMIGAKTKDNRLWLMEHLAGIICVSDYIKNCFLDGLPLNDIGTGSVHSVLNGTSRSDELHLPKDKSILIIGRMVPEKVSCQPVVPSPSFS